MDEKVIPYIAHESEVARLERIIKRMWILCIIIFLALIGTNAGWLYYESQFIDEVVTETYTSETDDGGTAIANREGSVIVYGAGEIHKDNENKN